MKFYIYKNKTNLKEYTIRLMEYVLSKWLVDDPAHADYVIVSICDITELKDIEAARQYKKKIITGGMISEYPIVNELSDYVWHGEIYKFRDHIKAGCSIEQMPGITSKNKKNLIIEQAINWRENPIIKVGRRAMYYYVSKGCPVKCKYCYIGNVREYQKIPETIYNKALKIAGKNLMPIAAYNPYGIPGNANIGETLLKKYLKLPYKDNGPKMIRSGVEFVTMRLSDAVAKGVTIDDLNGALTKSKKENTKMILYFIAGLESQGEIEEFFSKILSDYSTMPPVNIVFTYLDPQPFTPFHDFDLRFKIADINTRNIYNLVSQINKRFRVLPLARPEKSTIRSLFGRCENIQDYKLVKSVAKLDYEEILEKCSHLLGQANIEEICRRPRKAILPAYWRCSATSNQ